MKRGWGSGSLCLFSCHRLPAQLSHLTLKGLHSGQQNSYLVPTRLEGNVQVVPMGTRGTVHRAAVLVEHGEGHIREDHRAGPRRVRPGTRLRSSHFVNFDRVRVPQGRVPRCSSRQARCRRSPARSGGLPARTRAVTALRRQTPICPMSCGTRPPTRRPGPA